MLRHLKMDGIYLDGIRFPRATSQRLRHIFDAEAAARRAAGRGNGGSGGSGGSGGGSAGGSGGDGAPGGAALVDASAPLLDLHAGPNLRSFIEHMPYLDSIWVGETRATSALSLALAVTLAVTPARTAALTLALALTLTLTLTLTLARTLTLALALALALTLT